LLILRYGGIGALLVRLIRECLRPVLTWETLCFFARDLSQDIPEIEARVPVELKMLRGDEVRAYRSALESAGVASEKIEARAARGERCAIGLSEGRLVHYKWLTLTPAWIPEISGTFVPKSDEAYVYDVFTPREALGNNLQAAISSRLLKWGRRQGYRRHVFYVRGDNLNGLRIVAKIGARRTAVVRRFHVRGLAGSWITGLRGPERPKIDFGNSASVRRLGLLGLWVHRR
jgi:hypothetical protein